MRRLRHVTYISLLAVAIAAGGSAASAGVPPADADVTFVQWMYAIYPERNADDGGAAFWKQFVEGGDGVSDVNSRSAAANAFAHSGEYAQHIVGDLYQLLLLRDADAGARAFFLDRITNHGEGLLEVEVAIFGSDEYFGKFAIDPSPPTAWVESLYEFYLDRVPSAPEAAFWVARSFQVGRSVVAFEIATSAERVNDEIAAAYEAVLDRAPDAGGAAFWSNLMRNQRLDKLEFAGLFLASDESFARITAGDNPPPIFAE